MNHLFCCAVTDGWSLHNFTPNVVTRFGSSFAEALVNGIEINHTHFNQLL